MELRTLRYFLETARRGSITKAAASLHISQPTLSKQLKGLEEDLGKKLLIRSNYSVKLTEEGILLKKRAEEIIGMTEHTISEIKGFDDSISGDIHIGAAETDSMKYIAQCASSLKENNPSVRFHLYSGNTEDISGRLDSGLLDFAVLVEKVNPEKYNYFRLASTDTWGLIMRNDSPLCDKETISLDDLLELPLILSRQAISTDYPNWFGDRLDSLNIIATFNLIYNAAHFVEAGLGYAVSFDRIVKRDSLTFRPLCPQLSSDIYVAWRKHHKLSPAAKLLISSLRSYNCADTVQQIF